MKTKFSRPGHAAGVLLLLAILRFAKAFETSTCGENQKVVRNSRSQWQATSSSDSHGAGAYTPLRVPGIMIHFVDAIFGSLKFLGRYAIFVTVPASHHRHNRYNNRLGRMNYNVAATHALWSPKLNASFIDIPDYILDYAPYCYLYSGEEYWPGPLSDHLRHTTPYIDYDPVPDDRRQPDLDNLDQLNDFNHVYLTSNDDPESYPDWIGGERHKPDPISHASTAPAVLIVVDKGSYVDAFWFFFYSFNLGNQVLGARFGNHVGDWEHTLIRFEKSTGQPIEVFYSEHEWGAAYRWEDAEKHPENGKRMLTYSAYGTHAMYRTAGHHYYVLPFYLLQDITDQGPLWDPKLKMYAYTYDPISDELHASTPDTPENWFHFRGRWGDKAYPNSDKRQYEFLGELAYDSGPTGPKFKNLHRSAICENVDEECIILDPSQDLVPREVQPRKSSFRSV